MFRSIIQQLKNSVFIVQPLESKQPQFSLISTLSRLNSKIQLLDRHQKQANLRNREYIRIEGTQKERQAYHQLARTSKQEIFATRKKLGDEYVAKHLEGVIDKNLTIDRDRGIAISALNGYPLFEAALLEAREKIDRRAKDKLLSKGSLDFVASSKKDFGSDSALAKLAIDPNLLVPITRYFGVLPILLGFDINRASSQEILDWSSHLYHLDPEDTTQIKVFIYLTDVDEGMGPFTALPADLSKVVAKRFNYKRQRLKDEDVYRAIGYGHQKVCLGATGTTIFCDTNRCFHYGGRIENRERYVLTIYYGLPTSTWFPLFPGDGEGRNLIPWLQPDPNDKFQKALLGRELVIPNSA
ncbi:MAG: hypothetical protein KME17_15255 [Cyanosarcina radialis HA8281-LM2]|jgi:hypothetical protein|nr:hypothetical protein [Cyanosarcina radialis HA8281-LM2]